MTIHFFKTYVMSTRTERKHFDSSSDDPDNLQKHDHC